MAEMKDKLLTLESAKYIYDDLSKRIEESSEPSVQPDMSQNDSTQPDYIKNRTHYVLRDKYDLTIDSSISIEVTSTTGYGINKFKDTIVPIELAGSIYYTCKDNGAFEEDANYLTDAISLGENGSWYWTQYGSYGSKMFIGCFTESGSYSLSHADSSYSLGVVEITSPGMYYSSNGDMFMLHSHTIYSIPELVVKLDEKYLPSSVVKSTNGKIAESLLPSSVVKSTNGKIDESLIPDSIKEIVQSDFEESDTSSDSYIKNRTHYIEYTTYSQDGYTANIDIDLSEYHGGSTSFLSFIASPEDVNTLDTLKYLKMTNFWGGDIETREVSAVGNNDYWYILSPDAGGEWGRPFHGVAIAFFRVAGEYTLGESDISINVATPGLYFSSEEGAWWVTDLYYPVYHKLDKNFLPEGIVITDDTGKVSSAILPEIEHPQSDMNQNDSTQPDYIKNRTHYEDTTGELLLQEENPITIPCPDGCYTLADFTRINGTIIPYSEVSNVKFYYPGTSYTPEEYINLSDANDIGNDGWSWVYKNSDDGSDHLFIGVRVPGTYSISYDSYSGSSFSFTIEITEPGVYHSGYIGYLTYNKSILKKLDVKFLPDEVPLLVEDKLPKDIMPANILYTDENGDAVIQGSIQASAITGHGITDITSSVTAIFESWMAGFSFSSDKYYTNVTIKYTYYNSTGILHERTISNISFTDIYGPSGQAIGYQDVNLVDWNYDWSCDLISATTVADVSENCIDFSKRSLTFGSTKLTEGSLELGSTKLSDGSLDLGSTKLTNDALSMGSTELTESRLAELVNMDTAKNPHIFEYQEEVLADQVVTIDENTPLCWMIDTTPQRIIKVPNQPMYSLVLESIDGWTETTHYGTGNLSEFIAARVIENSSNPGCYVAPNYLYAGEFEETPYDNPVLYGRNFRCYTSYYYAVKSINGNELTVDIHRIIASAGVLSCNKANVDTSITIGNTTITEAQLQKLLAILNTPNAEEATF